ncbi:MAG: transposase, partial [Acidobacteriota bacterium]|nr:transposase [Acidobacteriota bacterium]
FCGKIGDAPLFTLSGKSPSNSIPDKTRKVTCRMTRKLSCRGTFYDFPAAHWVHIRTTNPIESTFSTVRHRQRQTNGCGSVKATISMAFKLAKEAEKRWRKIRGYELIFKVLSGVKFVDGEEKKVA